jgi:hypothetical protein
MALSQIFISVKDNMYSAIVVFGNIFINYGELIIIPKQLGL